MLVQEMLLALQRNAHENQLNCEIYLCLLNYFEENLKYLDEINISDYSLCAMLVFQKQARDSLYFISREE